MLPPCQGFFSYSVELRKLFWMGCNRKQEKMNDQAKKKKDRATKKNLMR